jgi:ribosomal protein L11 methyltransferase
LQALDACPAECDTPSVPSRHATQLQTLAVDVPAAAVPAYEAALQSVCSTVGQFLDDTTGLWRVEGVKPEGDDETPLTTALLLAQLVTGVAAPLSRTSVPAEGWLARTQAAFPEQRVGRRFILRGTHLPPTATAGRLLLRIDAGLAFGSGEHGSTRGCLRALERIAPRLWRHRGETLDLGTGSGVLALAAAKLLHRRILATDIDPWSVRTTRDNIRLNQLTGQVRCVRANGWSSRSIAAAAPFDLVFANILARPLCAMAADLAAHLAPGGTAILAGLLTSQARLVLAAHRRAGLVLEAVLREGNWATLILRKAGPERRPACARN